MKKIIYLLFFILATNISAQELLSEEILAKPSEGKSMVYIARRETAAILVKFNIYDGDLLLGGLAFNKYFAYECDPGEHVFIAKGENTFYVDATLEAGKTYVIDLRMRMGILTARVALVPLDKSNKKFEKEKKKFLKFVYKKKGELLSVGEDTEDDVEDNVIASDETMSKRLKKFYENKANGKKITTITPDMYFE